tara:strand:- start:11652 stop:12635 length:984 start_codon:yes stop_codon:yes gene_type:complete
VSKKIIINKLGGPDVLELVDYTLPENPPKDCVRIKQSSVGLNYIDTYFRRGIYPTPSPLPVCPGLEAAGEIIAVGESVVGFEVGDRVCYASPPLGAYCEMRDFPISALLKTPEYITNDEVASVLLQGMTVEYLFERLYKVKKGEFVLFHAAAGGVGLIACQWASAIGCKLIGTVGSEEKALKAKLSGCDYIINYKTENVVKTVMEITSGKGVPVVYDGVGKETFEISLNCLSIRGLFVSFGQSSGMVPDVNLHKTFNPKSLYYTRPTLMHYNNTRDNLEKSSAALFDMIKNNKVKTNLSKLYDLKDVAKAHSDLESRKTSGSVVLRI